MSHIPQTDGISNSSRRLSEDLFAAMPNNR